MKVPLSTIWAHSLSYSSWEPSTQWMVLGLVSSAIFSTHLRRCLLSLSGRVVSRTDLRLVVGIVTEASYSLSCRYMGSRASQLSPLTLSLLSSIVIFPAAMNAQVIPFESGGLMYKALTRGGVTIMFAPLSL